jgi:hypothetical protein
MSSCLGLLHLVDGLGRMLGAAFALAVYGWMRNSSCEQLYWPVVVGVFLIVTIGLHFVAHALARQASGAICHPSLAGITIDREADP